MHCAHVGLVRANSITSKEATGSLGPEMSVRSYETTKITKRDLKQKTQDMPSDELQREGICDMIMCESQCTASKHETMLRKNEVPNQSREIAFFRRNQCIVAETYCSHFTVPYLDCK